MVKRRKRSATPLALLWTRRDQLRFSEAVERLVSCVNDLVVVVAEMKRERVARPRPTRPRPAPTDGQPAEGVRP